MPTAASDFEPGDHPPVHPVTHALTLVLPAHNEEPVIQQAIVEAVDALTSLGIEFEVVVIDDGSTDQTARVARETAQSLPQVRVVSLEKNVGYAGALRRGFQVARFPLVAFTDADCQFDLRDLGKLLKLSVDHDLACGYRVDRQDPWRRKLYSRGFNVMARAMLGTRVRDCDCALKIFRRDWVNSAGLECQGFFFNAELLAKARQAGLTIAEAGVTHRPRPGGESKVSIWHIPPVFQTLVRFWWSKVAFSKPVSGTEQATPKSAWGDVAALVSLIVIASLMLLTRLSYPLMDPDESRYAQIGREMVDSGDWIVPRRNGLPYLDKPPLLYWCAAASYQAFGETEAAAHLVPALATLLTVIATFLLGRQIVGTRSAWLGSVMTLCCAGFMLSGRFLFMDTLLTTWTTIGVLSAYVACRGEKIRIGYWLLAAISVGLGVLTKGPVAMVLCLPPLVLSLWLTGKLPQLPWKLRFLFVGIVASIAIPWFVALHLVVPEALSEFIWKHHVERFVSGLEHAEPFYFYVPILLGAMLPGTILLPAVVSYFWGEEPAVRQRRNWDIGFLILAASWTFTLFSAARCKLPPYILPMIPPMCLAMGSGIAGILAGDSTRRFVAYVREKSPRDLCVTFCAAAVITAGIDLLLPEASVLGKFAVWAGLLVCGLVIFLPLSRDRHSIHTRWGSAGAFALLAMSAMTVNFYPRIAQMRSYAGPIQEICHDEIGREPWVVCLGLPRESDSIAFYFTKSNVTSYEEFELERAIDQVATHDHTLLMVLDILVDEMNQS
ncbi:MAG: glycosyltransferase, partial [Planctomycetota bacterium]|nr:glycosyltransferase [Planctomycetota bacterium]